MRTIVGDVDALYYVTTGKTRTGSWLWRRLSGETG